MTDSSARAPLLPALLAVALMLAGVAQAMLHAGAQPASGAMAVTLCNGTQALWLDAEGSPVPPPGTPAVCPDCIAALGPALPGSPLSAPRPLARIAWRAPGRRTRPGRLRPQRPPARAPPHRR